MIFLNGEEMVFTEFPNGETHLGCKQINKNLFHTTGNMIAFKYESDAEFMKLLFLKRRLDELTDVPCYLIIYYMPYSRMDRLMSDSVFTLKYVADFINSMNFRQVYVMEAHSDVTTALLNNCTNINITNNLLETAMKEIGFDKEKDYLFYPDAGAQKRYSNPGYNELIGFKKRGVNTGRVESLTVVGEMEPGQKVVIVDDLCSKGTTFLRSAEALKELGAGDIYLVVGHCEETIYDGEIFRSDLIKGVYTSDSIISGAKHEKMAIPISLLGTVIYNK